MVTSYRKEVAVVQISSSYKILIPSIRRIAEMRWNLLANSQKMSMIPYPTSKRAKIMSDREVILMPVCPLAYFSITSLVKAIQLECRVGCELDINSNNIILFK